MAHTVPPVPLTVAGELPEPLAGQAAEIISAAFWSKLRLLTLRARTRDQAVRILACSMDRRGGFFALSGEGLAGVIGLVHGQRRLIRLAWPVLRREFGVLGGAFRQIIARFEDVQRPAADQVRVELIAVAESMRGQGVGTALLNASFDYARTAGARQVILEVVDTNHGALKLYQRMGFAVTRRIRFGWVTRPAGFTGVICMARPV